MTVTWASPTVTWDSTVATWNMLGVPVLSDTLRVGVWKKLASGYGKVAQLDTWQNLTVEDRHNEPGTWSLTVPMDVQALRVQPDSLVTFDFRGTRFTGLIERMDPASDARGNVTLEIGGTSAWSYLHDTLVYPDPGAGVQAQLTKVYRASGPAETVIRNLVVGQMTRLGYDLVAPESQGRGQPVTVNVRLGHPLGTLVNTKAREGLIGVSLGLVDTTSSTRAELRLGFYVPTDRSNRVRLSHRLGTLGAWKRFDGVAQHTRAVVAGAAEDTDRRIGNVSVSADSLTLAGQNARHQLATGSKIKFVRGNPPDPLEPNTAYYAIRVDANTFKVARTRVKAAQNQPINLTNEGGGPITVVEVNRRLFSVAHESWETTWGRKREVFVDARDQDEADSDDALRERGLEALEEAGPQAAFELESVEALGMRYGQHFWLGDQVTIEPLPGVTQRDRLGAVSLTWDASAGLVVKLVPGNPDAINPFLAQGRLVRGWRRRQGTLEREAGD